MRSHLAPALRSVLVGEPAVHEGAQHVRYTASHSAPSATLCGRPADQKRSKYSRCSQSVISAWKRSISAVLMRT
jgi:hypothetical protein